ncbi:hypothetical protein MICRO80W_210015 [Micrococcus luteus]|nr:hypothetical protein MICRO80W_210015 [Micrococcus luteus]
MAGGQGSAVLHDAGDPRPCGAAVQRDLDGGASRGPARGKREAVEVRRRLVGEDGVGTGPQEGGQQVEADPVVRRREPGRLPGAQRHVTATVDAAGEAEDVGPPHPAGR